MLLCFAISSPPNRPARCPSTSVVVHRSSWGTKRVTPSARRLVRLVRRPPKRELPVGPSPGATRPAAPRSVPQIRLLLIVSTASGKVCTGPFGANLVRLTVLLIVDWALWFPWVFLVVFDGRLASPKPRDLPATIVLSWPPWPSRLDAFEFHRSARRPADRRFLRTSGGFFLSARLLTCSRPFYEVLTGRLWRSRSICL